MTNEKGSIIVVVLMVLGVVGLLGVTLITQSRMDLQFSQSTKSYDRMFSSADGAASYALRRISSGMTRQEVIDALAAAPGGLNPGTHITVDPPDELQDSTAKIFLERVVPGGGPSDPDIYYLRIQGEASSPVWGGDASGGNPTSIVEISVEFPGP